MATFTVSAPKVDRKVDGEYDFGGSLAAAAEKFGDEIVYSNFEDSAVIALQAAARRRLEATNEDGTFKYSDADIAEFIAQYKPGVKAARASVSTFEKAKALFAKLSPEELRALLGGDEAA